MASRLSIYSPGGRGRRGGLLIIGEDIARPPPSRVGKEALPPMPGPLFSDSDEDDFLPPAMVPDNQPGAFDPRDIAIVDDDGFVVFPDPVSGIEWQLLQFPPGSLVFNDTATRVLYAEDIPDEAFELYADINQAGTGVFRIDTAPGAIFVEFPVEEPVWMGVVENRGGVGGIPWSADVARGMVDRLAEVHVNQFEDGSRAYHGNFLNGLFVDAQTDDVILVLLSWIESDNGLEKDLNQLAIAMQAQGQDAAAAYITQNLDTFVQLAPGRTVERFFNSVKAQIRE